MTGRSATEWTLHIAKLEKKFWLSEQRILHFRNRAPIGSSDFSEKIISERMTFHDEPIQGTRGT
jgi:hypothetical protein